MEKTGDAKMRRTEKESLLDKADEDQQSLIQHMQWIDLDDGSSLEVLDIGQGEPIIFVNTVPDLAFVYARQLEEFRSDHRVILYQPRVNRRSKFSIEARAEEIELLLTALELKSAHIVAWSDAGSGAYYFGKKSPEKCLSIVFLGLADEYKFPKVINFLAQLLLHFPIEGVIPPDFVASFIARYFNGPTVPYDWVIKRAKTISKLPQLLKYSLLPMMLDHHPHTGEVKIKCLVVCGDKDALVSVQQAQRMAELLSDMEAAIIIPDGEHLLPYVNAALVNKTLRGFYSNLARS